MQTYHHSKRRNLFYNIFLLKERQRSKELHLKRRDLKRRDLKRRDLKRYNKTI